jgi:hypothetical protein
MPWIYPLESISQKMKSKPPPIFPIFYGHHTDNSHNSQCALSEEEEGGTVYFFLYRDTVAMGIVTSARPSLMMHSRDGRAGITMPIATDNVRRY